MGVGSLSQARDHQILIISGNLTLDSLNKILLELVLVGSLDLVEVLPIPVHADYSRHEQIVLCAHSGHSIFELRGVRHGAVGGSPHHQQKGVFHVAGELGIDHLLHIAVVLLLPVVVDRADLAVTALGQDTADSHLVGADTSIHGTMQICRVAINLIVVDRCRLLSASGGHDEAEELFGFHRQVALDVGLERFSECFLIRLFNGTHVGVGATK
jgi:hypothetical protein